MGQRRPNYRWIVFKIYLALPFTLLKQRLFFRLRKPPAGLPGFLCIGTQKSGTTWLNEQLKKHPALCMPSPKEVRFFDWYFYRSFQWYLAHFNCPPEKLRGEVTPGYSIMEKGRVRFLRRTIPGLKIILLLRDPRERAWSSARYHLGRQLGRDLSKVSDAEFIRHLDLGWVKRMGNYKTIWKKWSSVFPREQLLVIFTEEIEKAPSSVMERICRFLEVETVTDAAALTMHPNRSEEKEMPAAVRQFLDEQYRDMIRTMPEWLGEENRFWKN